MLDQIRKRQRWLTAFFIFAIGIVFVFFLGLGGSTPPIGTSSSGNELVIVLDDVGLRCTDALQARVVYALAEFCEVANG